MGRYVRYKAQVARCIRRNGLVLQVAAKSLEK